MQSVIFTTYLDIFELFVDMQLSATNKPLAVPAGHELSVVVGLYYSYIRSQQLLIIHIYSVSLSDVSLTLPKP